MYNIDIKKHKTYVFLNIQNNQGNQMHLKHFTTESQQDRFVILGMIYYSRKLLHLPYTGKRK
jgi:hypothetical protein